MHKYIRGKSDLRVKIQAKGNEVWKRQVQAGLNPSIEHTNREIDYDSRQLHEDFLPKYREMLEIFRKNYWLAEPETRKYYADVIEYVEGWTRHEAKGVNPETLREIGHSEENLRPFYQELENRTEILRGELAKQ